MFPACRVGKKYSVFRSLVGKREIAHTVENLYLTWSRRGATDNLLKLNGGECRGTAARITARKIKCVVDE